MLRFSLGFLIAIAAVALPSASSSAKAYRVRFELVRPGIGHFVLYSDLAPIESALVPVDGAGEDPYVLAAQIEVLLESDDLAFVSVLDHLSRPELGRHLGDLSKNLGLAPLTTFRVVFELLPSHDGPLQGFFVITGPNMSRSRHTPPEPVRQDSAQAHRARQVEDDLNEKIARVESALVTLNGNLWKALGPACQIKMGGSPGTPAFPPSSGLLNKLRPH